MSAFLDMVDADREIFLNIDEFASEHVVDGEAIRVSLQDEELEEKDDTRAVTKSSIVMYAKTEELHGRKMRGETIEIDDVGYIVESWLDEMGVTKVTMTLPESW